MSGWQTVSATVAIAFFMGGVAVAIVGSVVSLVGRKPGVTFSQLFWAGSAVAAHPERYVRAERVGSVRAVNLTGVMLFLGGVVILLLSGIARLL